ncbi:D-Ala-D-Ala carboxypeptidase VanY [Lysinibacillus odysseyi]|uniref:D-alanyl-D-alanine carboxypeptidase-like core domain-containing protein n=1 Tax=Lysinibacillus odysseyi 34hs-1 = NBRC 100172 TaxID=1220589 RepID=A0A0A3J0Z7_9BACI|nr:D-Ala-D-Ala carboxypeptidase VanY [Lysinibacillus odysseyi]KGR89370.1 hypothetical protein CD32_00395 [Lysinibacillus odysseyi 34hs-1 = NBRC 100172]
MKKWIFFIFPLVIISFFAYEYIEFAEAPRTLLAVENDQVYRGELLLVSRDFSISEQGLPNDIVMLGDYKSMAPELWVPDTSIRISRNLLQNLGLMLKEAKKDRVDHFMINSAYRNLDTQAQLYKEMGSEYALPAGHSEHNLGLSVDIGSTDGSMDTAPEGRWLEQNAWKYGFILRYPKNKREVTGIQYEPWHFRFVGFPHSAIMHKENWVLEEYLAYLREHRQYKTTVQGIKYEITYYEMVEGLEVPVIPERPYYISGDNMSGVIVTVER